METDERDSPAVCGSTGSPGLDEAFAKFPTNVDVAKPSSHRRTGSLTDEGPWQNGKILLDGRSAANPEYLMSHLRSLEGRGVDGTLEGQGIDGTLEGQGIDGTLEGQGIDGSLLSCGDSTTELWDDEVTNLEKELAVRLDQAEVEKEELELLKSKKLRRKHYIETLQLQFGSLENLKNARQDEVDSLQKQVDLNRLKTAHLTLEKNRATDQARQLGARCSRAENVMNCLKKEITNLQTETDLDRELMDACLTYSEKHQAEYNMLEKYCLEDEEKLKDCMFRVDRLAPEEEKSRKDQEAMELLTKGTQLEFERIHQQVREGNADRNSHVEHWAKIKHQVHSGENDIQRLQEELDSLSAKRTAKLETLARQREFHQSEIRNNNQLVRKLEETEFHAVKVRDLVTDMEKKKQELLDQIHAFENVCAIKSRTIKSLNGNIKNLSKQTQRVKDEIEKWRDLAHAVEVKTREVNGKKLTDEERLAELSGSLDQCRALVRAANHKVIKLRDTKLRCSKKNAILKADLDAATATVSGNALYRDNLYGQLKQHRTSAHSQAQQTYDLAYKVTQLERRIALMDGTDTGPSQKSVEEVKHLTGRRNHIIDQNHMMKTRIFKQEEWIKNLKKQVDLRDAQQKKNEIALAEIMLYLHTTERSVEKAKSRKIESAVEVSSSRLKLRYVADKADVKLDTVTGLSVRHLELSGLFKERMATVGLEREEYRAQRSRVEEQRSWFVKILRELEHQQRGVKTRFELLTLPISEDQGQGDGQDILQMQAAFFVKAAYEKQNIISNRTQLKEDIQKVMQDNYRLRHFLQKYEAQTRDLKSNVFHVKQKSVMDQKQEGLDDEISFLRERLRAHESQVFGYKEELQILRQTTDKLELLKDKVQQGMRQEDAERKALLIELEEQKLRLDRTLKQNGLMLAGIKKTLSGEDWCLVKIEIELSLYTDAERLLYSTIGRFLDAYPEAFTMIERLFKEMSIQMSEELTKALLRSAAGSRPALRGPTGSMKLSSAR